MKSKDIFWGVLLVGIGVLFLLRNFDIIHFDWYQIRRLWPLLIILLGIAILPVNGFIRILAAFVIIFISGVYLAQYTPKEKSFFSWPRQIDRQIRSEKEKKKSSKARWSDQLLYESYNTNLKHAVLELDAIAGAFIIKDTEEYLLKFEKEGNIGEYELISEEAGNNAILRLSLEDSQIKKINKTNNATISLHTEPLWDLKIDAAAAKIDFDLQPFKIDRIEIDGGASSMRIKLGDKHLQTNVRINAGVASVIIEVPESSGCEIYTSTALTKRSLSGFFHEDNNTFRTENFDNATNKVFIRIDVAVSSFKVVRY
ncbi:MAG: hypothetical protein EOM23_04235 [Candidatus Moranbacteria bacterium]|nr:hypothetical protein [Candidatus Moranbacteria bacterium]